MNSLACSQCSISELSLNGTKACIEHVYKQFISVLENLIAYIVNDPGQIKLKVNQSAFINNQREIILLPLYLSSELKTQKPGLDIVTLSLHSYILKLCQYYLIGLETNFGQCLRCNLIEIDYISFKICGCNPQFNKEFNEFKLKYNERQKIISTRKEKLKKPLKVEQPFVIWDKIERMVREYTNKKIAVTEIICFYNPSIHKQMWDFYDEWTEIILSESESRNNSRNKSKKYDGSKMCYFCLVDIESSSANSIVISSPTNLIPLYQIFF